MTTTLNRDALSKLVVYPQNAHFVRTGDGDLFPIDHIKKQLQDRVQQHSRQISKETLFASIAQVALIMLVAIICTHLVFSDPSKLKNPGETLLNRLCFGSFGLLCSFLVLFLIIDLYDKYTLDRDPEAEFLRRLKNSPIAVAKVESVSRLSNHDVELVFRFELMQNNGENGQSQLNRYKAKSRVSPSKIYEPGDEILVLYYDNSLLTVL